MIAQTLAVDIGMPVRLASERSVTAAVATILETLRTFENSCRVGARRSPSNGNAALLMGWTDPLLSFCRRVPVVIAAGNAICVKPSSRAPRTVAAVAALALNAMREAGMPLGLLAVLNGFGEPRSQGETVGNALLTHPGIKTIFWIGSTAAAEVARTTALSHAKRFHFVGSGRNPAIFFNGFEKSVEDAQLNDFAHVVIDPHSYGPYRASRFFVHESIYKDILVGFEARFRNFKIGDPLDIETDIGPLPKRETKSFTGQLQLALSETGRLVTGGQLEGGIPQPTLVRDLTNCSTLQGEELAGPWATVASFKYSHEAIKYANTSPLGLAGYVLHPDLEKANGIAEKLEVSRVFFSSQPSWPQAFTSDAPAVKHSANEPDGVEAIFNFSQWGSTHFPI